MSNEVPDQVERLSTEECFQKNVGQLQRAVRIVRERREEEMSEAVRMGIPLYLPDMATIEIFKENDRDPSVVALRLKENEPIPDKVRDVILGLVELARGAAIAESKLQTPDEDTTEDGRRVEIFSHYVEPFSQMGLEAGRIWNVASLEDISGNMISVVEQIIHSNDGFKYYYAMLHIDYTPGELAAD